jgi:hypothetical protein
MSARAAALVVTSLLWLAAGAARGDTPQVYDPSVGPGGAKILDLVSNATVDVYIDAGVDPTSGGADCKSSPGDELCAADVILTLDGPGLIVGFDPPPTGPPVIFHPDPSVTPTTTLRLNLLTSMAPVLGPKYLGVVTVDMTAVTQANPSRVEASGQVVDAAGTLRTIPLQTIAVPEPSHAWLLGSGILGLALLYRLRGRE